jgi:hypothetical protein
MYPPTNFKRSTGFSPAILPPWSALTPRMLLLIRPVGHDVPCRWFSSLVISPPRVLLLRFLGQVNLLPATRRFPSRLLRLLTSEYTTTLGLNIRHDWTLFFSDFPAAGAREVVVARSVDVGKLAIAAGVHPAAGGTRWSLQGLSSRLVARLPFKTKGDADYVDHRRWESESLTPVPLTSCMLSMMLLSCWICTESSRPLRRVRVLAFFHLPRPRSSLLCPHPLIRWTVSLTVLCSDWRSTHGPPGVKRTVSRPPRCAA